MPNSLKCRLKKLAHQGLLNEKDILRLYTDKDVIKEFENIKSKLQDKVNEEYIPYTGGYTSKTINWSDVLQILDKRISELKERKR